MEVRGVEPPHLCLIVPTANAVMLGMLQLIAKISAYQRRRPELTDCYQIVNEHLATFVEDRNKEGRPLPGYVKEVDFVWETTFGQYAIEVKSGKVRKLNSLVDFVKGKNNFIPLVLDLDKGRLLLSQRVLSKSFMDSLIG